MDYNNRNSIKKTIFGICLVLIFSTAKAQRSQLDVETYLKEKNNPTLAFKNKTYLQGVSAGLGTANISVSNGQVRELFFCLPELLSLTADNITTILDNEIEHAAKYMKKTNLDEFPISILLMDGLKRTFPCK